MTTVPSPTLPTDAICVRGARTHNLQNLDVDLPLGRFTTISGVSGSGKSSLAFDTIHAEGLHRYLATVSPHTRELLARIDRPDVDLIDGLPPTLGLEQRFRGPRRRTTLATITDLYDYFRLLYARVGHLHCPTCHQPVTSQSREAIVDQVLKLEERRKVLVLAPVVRAQAGAHAETLARIGRDGFVRARIDGELVDLSSPPDLVSSQPHSIEVVVDRLVIKEGIRSRVEESVDLALQIGQGQCILSHDADGSWIDRLYSSRLACTPCGVSFPSVEPGDFSFNSPRGACPTCHGLGSVANPETPDEAVQCPDCHGHRLSLLPLSVWIDGTSIGQLAAMTAPEVLRIVTGWMATTGQGSAAEHLVRHLIPEIISRLTVLINLGLDYLALDRAGDTLSAGEFQRARLTACLGNQLTGVCYVIDEPTAGLHACDTQRLLQTLFQLRDQGNTLVVVEHDLEMIRRSDYTIEVGPGAGSLGGHLIAACPPDDLIACEVSVTGRELRRRTAGLPPGAGSFQPSHWIRLEGATLHNLQQVSLNLPLHRMVCLTGVSGSGKTSLIMHTLVPALQQARGVGRSSPGPFRELQGADQIARLIQIDQRPLGRSERSTPATYSGVWDEVRKVFAKTRESRIRGYSPRRFSPQHAEGRCPRCAGRGTVDLDRKQLVEWPIRCPECAGRRFNPQTLAVHYRGVSVADVMEMTIDQAAEFFANFHRLERPLHLFQELGLGYLQLGQPATTLSGGEAQRVKLATELWKSDASLPTMFILDEPTSGLHPADVVQMLQALRRLVDSGNSVVVIEHHLDLIAASDWVIDLGPGAGASGGRIVAEGPPQAIADCESSLTGQALRAAFRH
ncbi:MAG: excinuclease ABC subunit UvrA [Planctomycetes bacterium]|nr:excinuclease ABC subunit UvrA [Planctomycetota bacterium]